ncbi:hypothetical protein [Mesorhizobium sp.]|uniref:hypothetical protein n=1 Tax=Mesorhizobium sp. TaxID=1871066 RepID=UPI00257F4337|nr:hypothetical protein [Mesorhizobium sp.]
MRAIAFFAGVLVATPSMAAERLIFYTANFPDATSVQLSVLSNSVSQNSDYDFDVAIGLAETDVSGAVRYEDTGKHRARVRCNYPAYVGAEVSHGSSSQPLRTR